MDDAQPMAPLRALSFRLDEIDRLIVLECVEKIGVRAVPLPAFVARTSITE